MRRTASTRLGLAALGLLAAAWPAPAQEVAVFTGVAVVVPRPTPSTTWDEVFSRPSGLQSIFPDVQVCVESRHVPPTCLPWCPNAAEWLEEPGTYICRQPAQILGEPNMSVVIRDIDGDDPPQTIWAGRLPNPGSCVGQACRFDTPGGAVQIEFQMTRKDFAEYSGPFRGTFEPPPPPPAPAPSAPPGVTVPALAPPPPAPSKPAPSLWEQVKDGWGRLTSYFSPADYVSGLCSASRGFILGWACDYFIAAPVRTTENSQISRIACLRGAFETKAALETANAACRSHPDGSGALELCLLRFFDPIPARCMAGSDMQGE